MRIDRTSLARLAPVDAAAQLGAAVQLGDLAVEAALELAKELRFPEEIQAALARAIAPPPGASAASLRAGFFIPVPGKDYRIDFTADAIRHAFDVRFGARLARTMLTESLKIDKATGQILDTHGRPDPRCPVSRARKLYAALTAKEAPPWVLLHPVTNSFYWPKVQAELELGTNTIDAREKGGVRHVFTQRWDDTVRPARMWTRAELEPIPAELWKPKINISHAVRFEAEDPHMLERAKLVFDRIIGPTAEKWHARETKLLAEAKSILELIENGTELVQDAKALLAVPKSEPWTNDDAISALMVRLDDLARLLAPVRVVVVPKQKHYSAMPHVDSIRKKLRERSMLGDAASLVLMEPATKSYVRLILISEEDLARDARDAKHELHHLLEDRYLSEDVVKQIDQIWARTVRRGGPFARSYGMQREEFFTTMGEEFEGAHGEEGRRWLRQNHQDLWEIFENVTRHIVH